MVLECKLAWHEAQQGTRPLMLLSQAGSTFTSIATASKISTAHTIIRHLCRRQIFPCKAANSQFSMVFRACNSLWMSTRLCMVWRPLLYSPYAHHSCSHLIFNILPVESCRSIWLARRRYCRDRLLDSAIDTPLASSVNHRMRASGPEKN